MSILQAPNLRTINFQRVSDEGIDFICKSKPKSIFANNKPVSFIYAVGKYRPGETVVQWRAEGICQHIDLDKVLDHVPEYTITQIVASARAREESHASSEDVSAF